VRLSLISVGPPYRGGISDLSALIYEELNLHHQVQFINYSRQYPKFLFPGKTEYKVGVLASDFPSERSLDSINPFTWLKAVKLIKSHGSDWAIFRYWNPFFAPLIHIMSRLLIRRGIRVAVLVDNLIPHEESAVDSWMARRVLSHSDHIFTMSKAVSKDVLGHSSGKMVTTLFHPLYEIYQARYTKAEAREILKLDKQPVILFFGLIRPYKGLDILINSLGLIGNDLGDYTAFILGEAYEDEQKYKDLILKHNLSSHIVYRNEFIPDDELPLYFAACDVLVLPYRTATQSGIIGIAYQMDRPVIATQVGGLGEYIKTGENGYLAPPEDPQALADTILKFFSGTDRDDMSEKVKSSKSEFSIENFCTEMVKGLIND